MSRLVHWTSVVGIGLGAAINAAILRPAWSRYVAWRDNPTRVPVAGRNWRGRYVPDLALIRLRRLAWLGFFMLPVVGGASLLFVIPHHN